MREHNDEIIVQSIDREEAPPAAKRVKVDSPNTYSWEEIEVAFQTGNSDELIEIMHSITDHANVKGTYGRNLIHVSAQYGRVEVLKILSRLLQTENFIDLANAKDANGQNALQIAAQLGKTEVIQVLYELLGAEKFVELAKAKNTMGRNALHIAVYFGQMACLKALLEIHPRLLDSKTSDGKNALFIAVEQDIKEVISYLVDEKKANILHVYAQNGDLEKFKSKLREKPSLLSALDNEGKDATLIALANKKYEIFKYLWECHRDKFKKVTYDLRRTIVHYVAAYGDVATVNMVMQHQKLLHHQLDANGNNVLHIAAEFGNNDASVYICGGKNSTQHSFKNAKNNSGYTPFEVAIIHGHVYRLFVHHTFSREHLLLAANNSQASSVVYILRKEGGLKNSENLLECASIFIRNKKLDRLKLLLFSHPEIMRDIVLRFRGDFDDNTKAWIVRNDPEIKLNVSQLKAILFACGDSRLYFLPYSRDKVFVNDSKFHMLSILYPNTSFRGYENEFYNSVLTVCKQSGQQNSLEDTELSLTFRCYIDKAAEFMAGICIKKIRRESNIGVLWDDEIASKQTSNLREKMSIALLTNANRFGYEVSKEFRMRIMSTVVYSILKPLGQDEKADPMIVEKKLEFVINKWVEQLNNSKGTAAAALA